VSRPRQAVADRDHTFLFADLAGFTALTEAHGDEEAANLAGSYFEQVAELLPDHGGEQIKTIGDALMVRTGDAAEAIRLALRIVHELGTQHGFPNVRVGIHTGPAVERGGDWFGATVNTAARVSGLASGGEVLLSDATREAAGEIEGVNLREWGRQELKNVKAPVLIYAALRPGERSDEGLDLDPVCRMAVEPGRSAGRLVYEGTEYRFCSLECASRFAAAPEGYVRER
jgi:adenylate cyclase